MKQLLIITMIVAGSLVASSASAQVHVSIGFESSYPGYTYYTYPAWHGHYQDKYYYAHYRPAFERDHRAYFRGRRFDHERYERETHWNGRPGRH